MRPDKRAADALRQVRFERNYIQNAQGAVLVSFGDTRVICTAVVEPKVPPFLIDSGKGWVTAEYAMLPASASGRVPRNHITRGRAQEISRLIGRSLRCIVDLHALGERQITIDCDVIQADGGTRTAAITGSYLALHDAIQSLIQTGKLDASPLLGQCAAISVGIVEDEPRLDLCYAEDSAADVDMNVVMREDGHFIEIQGSAEGQAFPRTRMNELIDLAERGNRELFRLQSEALEA